jgi:hypothetical protein
MEESKGTDRLDAAPRCPVRLSNILNGAEHGTLKSYPGLHDGMPTTHAETINADLFEFIKT